MRRLAPLLMAAALTFAVGCGKKPEPAGPSPSPEGGPTGTPGGPTGGPAVADKERLQGVWAVESLDTGDPRQTPTADMLKAWRFQFDGNRLMENLADSWNGYTFRLDENANPKAMVFPDSKLEWLYKFDGDALVLAITDVPSARPKEFKARQGGEAASVSIYRLKKTNEAPKKDSPPKKKAKQ